MRPRTSTMLQQNNNNNYPCLNASGSSRETLHKCTRGVLPFPARLELGLGDLPLVRGLRAWALCSKNRRKPGGGPSGGGRAPTAPPVSRRNSDVYPSGEWGHMGYGLPLGLDARQAGIGALVTVATLKTSEGGGKTQTQCLFLRTERGSCLYSTAKPGAHSPGVGPGISPTGAPTPVGGWLRGKVGRGSGGGRDGSDRRRDNGLPPPPQSGASRIKMRSGRKWRKSCCATGPGQEKGGPSVEKRSGKETAGELIVEERREEKDKGSLLDNNNLNCKQFPGLQHSSRQERVGANGSPSCCHSTSPKSCSTQCLRRVERGVQRAHEGDAGQRSGGCTLDMQSDKAEERSKETQERNEEETDDGEEGKEARPSPVELDPDLEMNYFYPQTHSSYRVGERSREEEEEEGSEETQASCSEDVHSQDKEDGSSHVRACENMKTSTRDCNTLNRHSQLVDVSKDFLSRPDRGAEGSEEVTLTCWSNGDGETDKINGYDAQPALDTEPEPESESCNGWEETGESKSWTSTPSSEKRCVSGEGCPPHSSLSSSVYVMHPSPDCSETSRPVEGSNSTEEHAVGRGEERCRLSNTELAHGEKVNERLKEEGEDRVVPQDCSDEGKTVKEERGLNQPTHTLPTETDPQVDKLTSGEEKRGKERNAGTTTEEEEKRRGKGGELNTGTENERRNVSEKEKEGEELEKDEGRRKGESEEGIWRKVQDDGFEGGEERSRDEERQNAEVCGNCTAKGDKKAQELLEGREADEKHSPKLLEEERRGAGGEVGDAVDSGNIGGSLFQNPASLSSARAARANPAGSAPSTSCKCTLANPAPLPSPLGAMVTGLPRLGVVVGEGRGVEREGEGGREVAGPASGEEEHAERDREQGSAVATRPGELQKEGTEEEEEDEFGVFMQAEEELAWSEEFTMSASVPCGSRGSTALENHAITGESSHWLPGLTDGSLSQSEDAWAAFPQDSLDDGADTAGQWWPVNAVEERRDRLSTSQNPASVFVEAFPSLPGVSSCDPDTVPTLTQLLGGSQYHAGTGQDQGLLDSFHDLNRMIGQRYKRASGVSRDLLLKALRLHQDRTEGRTGPQPANRRLSPGLPSANRHAQHAAAKRRLSYDYNRNVME
ncbi:uncharacterized protein si:ch211-14c7.2 isoform X2 [Lampris incognitus]|uniref:uncharacterized protein si:ch211-14c7.2 isoform X2 n=1 Tax=Lampris incognitus TaxID=2546036 RepID=UPI0024B5FB2B|nr:uncharacterized protein si:ch211-14c7.2 isoform X2 [Lampris incognitus]